jgi:hypothetical protein
VEQDTYRKKGKGDCRPLQTTIQKKKRWRLEEIKQVARATLHFEKEKKRQRKE